MSRIRRLFQTPGGKVIPYITAGYPDLMSTKKLVLAAEKAGADLLELGIPFSDPLADGPVIQASSQKALSNGTTVDWVLNEVRAIRRDSQIPLVLMGYLNPMLSFGEGKERGLKTFIIRCADVGVDGLIVPDLPPEEADTYLEFCHEYGVSPILLVAPNTAPERIKSISQKARDLIYCVSVLGITGAEMNRSQVLNDYLDRVRKNSVTPFIVGFGVKQRADVIQINRKADGAVVGTALIERLRSGPDPDQLMEQFVRELKGNENK